MFSPKDIILSGTTFEYTEKSCKNLCKQFIVSETCNCTSIFHVHSVHIEDMSIDKRYFYLFALNDSYFQETLRNTLCEYLGYSSMQTYLVTDVTVIGHVKRTHMIHL